MALAFAAGEIDLRMLVQQAAFTIHRQEQSADIRHLQQIRPPLLCQFVIPAAAKERLGRALPFSGISVGGIFPDLAHLASELKGLFDIKAAELASRVCSDLRSRDFDVSASQRGASDEEMTFTIMRTGSKIDIKLYAARGRGATISIQADGGASGPLTVRPEASHVVSAIIKLMRETEDT